MNEDQTEPRLRNRVPMMPLDLFSSWKTETTPLSQLIEKYSGMVMSVYAQILHDRHQSKILLYTFYQLVKNASSIRNGTLLAAWLHTVATNESIKLLRSRQKHSATPSRGDT
ncbi:MAG: hypothetical protein R3C11_16735 [Planctomycetaceae bacterium]